VLDTNVWIYGLRQDRDYPACSELLEKLRTFQVVIPRQVLVELQVNLSPREYQRFWQLINAYSARAEISWDPAPAERLTDIVGSDADEEMRRSLRSPNTSARKRWLPRTGNSCETSPTSRFVF
jgi:hypothetical protein